jgi:hypothetical protein
VTSSKAKTVIEESPKDNKRKKPEPKKVEPAKKEEKAPPAAKRTRAK